MAKSSSLESFIVPNVEPTAVELGRGAYGSVQEVKIPGAVCAAKTLHDDLVRGDSNYITRTFLEECRLMSTLRHPHIVQFLGICYLPRSNLPTLVMEKLETSLHELLETSPDIPLSMKRSIHLDIAHGLFYLHSHSPPIIHRDLTARNVLFNSSMVAKISDLGVAKIVDIRPGRLAATMTKGPGNIVYMPPEAMEDHAQYDTSIDIFSFGNIVLFTLTQVFPKLKAATYTDPKTQKIIGRSEIERREDSFQQVYRKMGDNNPFVRLARDCLQNLPKKRPTATEVTERLEQTTVDAGNTYELQSKLSLIKTVEIITERNKALEKKDKDISENITRLHMDNDSLRQQIREKEEEMHAHQEQLRIHQQQLLTIQASIRDLQAQIPKGLSASELLQIQDIKKQLEELQPRDKVIQFPISFKWKNTNEMPFATGITSSVTLEGKVCMSTGNSILVYSPLGEDCGNWTKMELPDPKPEEFAIAVVKGQLALVGGKKDEIKSASIFTWDGTNWVKPYPPMPIKCEQPSVVGYKQYLIVAGGIQSIAATKDVFILDTNTKQWYQARKMPLTSCNSRPVIIGNDFYLVIDSTGRTGIALSKKALKVSLPALIDQAVSGQDPSSLWEELPEVPFYLSTPCAIGNMLAVIGGRPGGTVRGLLLEMSRIRASNPSPDIYIFNPTTNQWVKVGELPYSAYDVGCAMLPSGQILVAGGKFTERTDIDGGHKCAYIGTVTVHYTNTF